jgi:hypothetical protein
MENGTLIIDMAAQRWNSHVVVVGGGITKITRKKVMEQGRLQ